MSSPAQPTHDDDIDIDFDDPIGGVELTEDERMADDSEQQRPATATDDMMEDDAPELNVPEQEMEDGFDAAAYEQADPDDELIDYGDDDYQDMTNAGDQNKDVYEQQAPEINIEDREPSETGFEPADKATAHEPVESAPEPVAAVVEDTVDEPVAPVHSVEPAASAVADSAETTVLEAPTHDDVAQAEPDNAPDASEEQDVAAVTASGQDELEVTAQHVEGAFPEFPEENPEEEEEDRTAGQIPAPVNTSLDTATDAPGTPTDTGLHPMIVRYGDWEWPLFKSRRQPEGLLKDDNLASVALADLLNNCRYRLAVKVGEDISEDQEFVLRFDGTGLAIVEVCTAQPYKYVSLANISSQNTPSAFNTSLDEILEVYKQLHINDGAQTIPPFWLYLSLQPKFTSYLTMLKQAAAGGQGMSSFVEVSAGEAAEEFGEYGEEAEEADNDPTMLGNAYAEEYQGQAEYDGHEAAADPELTETDYREYDTSYEATDGDHEAEEGYDEYDEAAYADYDQNDEHFDANGTAEATEPTETPEESYYLEEPVATADESHQGDEKENADSSRDFEQTADVSLDNDADGTGEGKEESNVESAASSTTLRVDQANDVTGEYRNDDLIDWDDATLTSNHSEHGLDDTDDFSTFLTEPDAEATVDDGVDGALSNAEGADVSIVNDVASTDESSALDDAQKRDLSKSQDNDHVQQLSEHPQEDSLYDDAEGPANDVAAHENDPHELKTSASADRPSGEESHDGVSHLATQGQKAAHEDVASAEPTGADEDYIDFGNEDDIDFDDDTYEQHEARKASEANSPVSKSPAGKRPLDDSDGLDLTEQPELKKVRSS